MMLSIGEIQARTAHLIDLGWKIKKRKLVSNEGVECKLRTDGCIELWALGMDTPKVIGPFESQIQFQQEIEKESFFNRYAEIEDLELKQWSSSICGFVLRNRKEVAEFLKIVSPCCDMVLYHCFDRFLTQEAYFDFVPKERRFENYPLTGRALLEELETQMEGPDWDWDANFDVMEALQGIERQEMGYWEQAQAEQEGLADSRFG